MQRNDQDLNEMANESKILKMDLLRIFSNQNWKLYFNRLKVCVCDGVFVFVRGPSKNSYQIEYI